MHVGPRSAGSTRATEPVRFSSAILVVALVLFGGPILGFAAQEAASGKEDLGEIGVKLANPVSDVWALFTEFDLYFNDGNVNRKGAEVGGRMIFQPILPFPLYGKGENRWKLVTRPNIPVIFSKPIPTGFDEFSNRGGLGDIQLPMMVSPPTGNWLLPAGPCWLFPTCTNRFLGRQQWGGPISRHRL